MYHFRIIALPDGNQVIDTTLTTPYNSLDVIAMMEYEEVDRQLYQAKRLQKKAERETRKSLKEKVISWLGLQIVRGHYIEMLYSAFYSIYK